MATNSVNVRAHAQNILEGRARRRFESQYEEAQREYERALEAQTAAQTAALASAQQEQNQGGLLGGIGYSLEKIGLGFLSGIEGIWDYTAGGLAKLFGADDWAEQQIANDWVNYNHADEWFNPSEGWQFVGDVAGGIGTSLPSMAGVAAAGAITVASGGTLSPVAATLIAGSIAGLGAAGRATKEAYDQTGELGGKEFGYGALSGITEGAIEGVSSALGAGTGAVIKSISKSFGKEVAKSATRNTLLKGVVKGFAGEAFEEGVQAILEPVYKRMTYDPNAKNATFQEVAYAALVGGLSGAIMGGGDVAVRNIRGTTRGNTLVNEGRAGDVIATAEQLSSYQTANQTDYETFQVVQNTLDELKTSLQKTGGEVRTVRQKMLLGVLEQANTSAAFEPIITASAENIYNNAETVAARLNELEYQDQNGKPIQVTAEQIREGIDTTDAKKFRQTMSKALKTNSVLRTLAVADTVGQISMDTARFRDAALSEQSSKLITQADLNRFAEQATDAERQAVADRLGIENWETLTNEQFHDRIAEFVENGGVKEYQQERSYVKEAQAVAPEAARKHLPRMVNLRNDGTYRYTQGGTDIAITKRGDSYYVYDYESGLMSKALSRTETNRVLREIYTNEENYQNGVRQHTEAQNRLREQAAEIDTYARENISEYKNLSAAGQAAIRATIRQGRAAGVQEDFVLSCARVSARSGLRVVFSKEASFVAANGSYADGAIDLKNNRIIINPEAKSRSGESILFHELTHAIYNDTDGSLTVAEGLEAMTDAEKEKIRKRYAAVGQGRAAQVSDEINAHFAEQTLSNKNVLERLVQKKQTLKEKILGFFKKARTDYQSDEKLTGAAARLYRQYKKLFDEFSARNQRYLGTENASVEAQAQAAKRGRVETIRFSLMNNRSFEENVHDILSMSDADARAAKAADSYISTMKHTPDVILSNVEGAQDLEVIIRFDALYLASRADGALDGNYHDLGAEITTQLPQLISDPDAIVRMDNGRLNILAEMKTDKGSSGIISIELNTVKDINSKYSKYNLVVSAFSAKDNYVRNLLQKRAERVEYIKKDLSQVNHQLHESLAIFNERSNRGGRTPSASADTLAGTSETNGRSSTTDSISQNSENVNSESQKGKKFALPTDYNPTAADNEYIHALNSGDMASAQMAVNKAAAQAGYTDLLYHGTKSFGFTVFDSNKSDDGISFFVTRSKDIARSYAKSDKVRPISSRSAVNVAKLSDAELVSHLNEHADELDGIKDRWQLFDGNEYDELNSSVKERLETLRERVRTEKAVYADKMSKDFFGFGIDALTHNQLLELEKVLNTGKYKDGDYSGISTPLWCLVEQSGAFSDIKTELSQLERDMRLARMYLQRSILDRASGKGVCVLKDSLGGYDLSLMTVEEARAELRKIYGRGIYELLGNSGRQLVIDAENQQWNAIKGWTRAIEPTLENTFVYKGDDEYALLYKDSEQAVTDGMVEVTNSNEEMLSKMSEEQIHIFLIARAADRLRIVGDKHCSTRDIALWAKNLGYDSVLIKNVNDYGGNGAVSEAGDIAIYYDPSRLKSADTVTYDDNGNVIPLSRRFTSDNADIRYALPETDSTGASLSQGQREYFKDSKVVDDNGKLRITYHGSPNRFFTFDRGRIGKGNDQFGAGFYFATSEEASRSYGDNVHKTYLNITKPIVINRTADGGDLFDVKITQKQAYEILKRHPLIYDPESSPLGDMFEEYWEVGAKDYMIREAAKNFNSIGLLDSDYLTYRDYPNELHEAIRDVLGYDGVEVRFDNTGDRFYVAWFENQIKLTTNKQPTGDTDIRFALSDSVINVDSANETAAWTSDRVTDLIDRYGARNPRYTQAYATWINPADFVKATTVNQTRRNQIYDEAGNLDIDALSRETQTPYLTVDYETMRIVGHEGRHRMAALAKAGVKRVAVAIRFTENSLSRYDARIMDGEHRLKGQSFSSWDADAQRVRTHTSHNSAAVGTLVPINAAYSAQLSEFTSERGLRFALDGSEEGNAQTRGNYSVGQRARFAANNTGMRVYTKAEAAEVINSIIEERLVFEEIGMQGELRGKDRQAVIDYLFQKLNTVKEGYRSGVALRIADYMIEHTVLTDMYADSNGEVSEAMHKLSVLRRYMHRIDLRHIRDEIQYRFDRKNSINLVWGAKEGGISPDTLPQILADEGIFLDAVNEADCFLQMVEMYEDARAAVNNATESVMLSTYGDARTIKDLRQQIARDVLNAYEQKGRKSKYAKLVEKYTKQIAELKQRLREANANNRLINSIVDQAQKMRDLKLGTFLNSTQYKSDVFKSSIEALGKIKFRGNFNIAGTRKIMADLRTWYTKENPLLADTYEEGIADMLDTVANGKTNNYAKSELQSIRNIMAYFTNYVEHFNKVYRQGRWVDAVPEATRYIETIRNNEQVKVGLFRKVAGSTYMQTFGDPMSVARRMDMYESGFYTEMLTELREAAIDAEITEMEIRQDYDAFLKKNRKYLSQAVKQTVEYRGVAIPRMHLISLYMTLKRAHAQAGLAQNGFAFTDADGKRVRVDGFAPEITEESDLRAAAIEEQARIAELLSETDKEYIAILEKAFNEDAKKLKAERDMQRLGFTNATEDYYYPIRRGNIAKNVDTSDIQGELDRVSSASFNKDTVRGAKQELFIEAADTVFNRHIHAVAQYAALSPAIETYNKLYNLDIGGNANKPVSVATESANTWAKGNRYFSKLISDIQGIPASPSEGMRVLSFVRGSYAKFQLGANPKVWATQLSSLFAASSILDANSIANGMFVSSKDVDVYCPLAKLRAQDNTVAMAQGVLDKVGRVSNALMAPIGKMDRFVVCRLFGACQLQVQKNGGAKVGSEANKIEAGKLLKRVILETQQNSLATERSAAMRSGNEIMRTVTMFSADSMKVIGRVIDSVGELSTLNAKLRMTTDTELAAELRTQINAAQKKVFKSVTALTTSALFMAAITQLFNWLYNKDRDDDETAAQQVLVDFAGNLLGGLPLVRDIYSRIMEGYSVDNYAYSALNDLLDSAVNLFDTASSLISGNESKSKLTARTKSLLYALGQLTGIPTRNIYNVFYGLIKRFSPTTAYQIDEAFYAKNYVTDLNKAIESDDTDMIAMLTSMIFGERMGNTTMSDAVRDKFVDLYSKGYSVLPRSIGDTISYGGVEIPLTDDEYARFRAIYVQSMKDIEKMMNNGAFKVLSEEMQAKAIKQVYDAYYYDALSDLVGVDERTAIGELSKWIDMSKLSVAFVGLSDIESEKNSKGETITGSKKKNTVKYLLKRNLSDGERLLILCFRGYSIQDGDYKGYTAKRAKRILLQYILKLKGTQVEKAAIAEKCGFTVRNGRIIKDF